MNTRELLELASLDALGLLDEQERDDFEKAFRLALPEVQAQIRREQLRFADLDRLLPEVEPPPGLRAKVLAAVREAIAAVTASEPVARIGPGAARLLTMVRVWRAACIGFATASLVLAGFVYEVAQENKSIVQLVASGNTEDEVFKNFGPKFTEVFFAANKREVVFTPVAADFEGHSPEARLILDPEKKVAVLLCKDLPRNGAVYTLVLRQDDGTTKRLREFNATGQYTGLPLPSIDHETVERFAILAPADGPNPGQVILSASQV